MPQAGELRDRVIFQQRSLDANDDRMGPFPDHTEGVSRAAKITYLHGTEAVQQQRLQGLQPVLIEVRADSATKGLNNTWRALDARSGAVYDIQGASPSPDRAFMVVVAIWKQNNG